MPREILGAVPLHISGIQLYAQEIGLVIGETLGCLLPESESQVRYSERRLRDASDHLCQVIAGPTPCLKHPAVKFDRMC